MNKLSLLYRRNLGILDGFLWGLNELFVPAAEIFFKTFKKHSLHIFKAKTLTVLLNPFKFTFVPI